MIYARALTRRFRVKRGEFVDAVRGVDLDVADGELVAVLGPNGAGKSTTLRMLTTLLRPTSGTAVVAGHDVVRDAAAVRRRIGYVGQGDSAGANHRARDEVVTQGRMHGLDAREAARRADELLASLDLADIGTRGSGSLSGGQRRRLDIAIGLAHRPPLLFLDEPSTGLDPRGRATLWEHVRRVRATHGTTIVVTTHHLDEADTVAERVVVIDEGRVIADGPPERLKADLAGDLLTLTTAATAADTVSTADDAATVAEAVARVPGARDVRRDGGAVRARVPDGHARLPELVRALDRAGVVVASAEVRRPTLDDVFLHLTGRSIDDASAAAVDRADDPGGRAGAEARAGAAGAAA